ncbi:MAG: GMC family oxidoreductase, partial [Myxococcota bacterium]|nr:GMC family oxidoreductase [Myxococcota bacterium]
MSLRTLGTRDLTENQEIRCDVCIVGSGAGGSVLAAGLVERGLDVVVLEEGGHYTRRDFDGDEGKAYSEMYRARGTFATADLSMTIMQGRTVGGGTTVNWTTCFRTPSRILDHWRGVHGVEGLNEVSLTPHWEAVEKRLGIREWPEASANANNKVLFDGCRKLGWEVGPMRRNVVGCLNTGYCGLGCPVDAKQGMALTYLKDAAAGGARVFSKVRAKMLHCEKKRVTSVEAEVLSEEDDRPTGVRILVRPKLVVCSGGAVGSPALLLRSGLDFNGRTGRRVWMHPVVGLLGVYPHEINGFYGAPQSAGSHHFIDPGPGKIGWFLETPPLQPMLISTANSQFGEPLRESMAQLPHMGSVIAILLDGLLEDEEGATISLRRDGRIRVDYDFRPEHADAFRAAALSIARVSLAAGAEAVHSGHPRPVVVRSEADLGALEAAPWGPHKHPIFTAHQMGGCAMGPDPETAVVDSRLRHHHLENLFVVDGSVLPTALGVNPSLTIYGLAHWATEGVAAA